MPTMLGSEAATLALVAASAASLRSSNARSPHTWLIGAVKRFVSSTAACAPRTTSVPYFSSGPERVTLTPTVNCWRTARWDWELRAGRCGGAERDRAGCAQKRAPLHPLLPDAAPLK